MREAIKTSGDIPALSRKTTHVPRESDRRLNPGVEQFHKKGVKERDGILLEQPGTSPS